MKNINLIEKLKFDLKVSIKTNETTKKNIIRLILSEIEAENARRKRGNVLNDVGMESLIRSIKKNLESIPLDKKTQETLDEIRTLESYLPSLLSKEETEKIVMETIDVVGEGFGKIMQTLNQKYKGKIDNKLASDIIREKIK